MKCRKYNIEGEIFTTEDLITIFLVNLKRYIDDALHQRPYQIIATTPAYFSNDQRMMLSNCYIKAGYNVFKMITEPSAAVVYYNYAKKDLGNKIMIYDMGGGTLDICLVNVNEGNLSTLPTNGNSYLGGVNWDRVIAEKVIMERLNRQYGGDAG